MKSVSVSHVQAPVFSPNTKADNKILDNILTQAESSGHLKKGRRDTKRIKLMPADLLTDKEALVFWERYFPEKAEVKPTSMFVDKFIEYHNLKDKVTDVTREALQLALDENHDGVLTLYEFENFVKQAGGMQVAIKTLILDPEKPTGDVKENSMMGGHQEVDFEEAKVECDFNILWAIPNYTDSDKAVAANALAAGYKTKILSSAAQCCDFLQIPKVQLYIRQNADRVRIMTHNHDYSPKFDMYSNGLAGEQVVKRMRRLRLAVPLLIYCNQTIHLANETVNKFGKTGKVYATNKVSVATDFACFKGLPS